MSEKLLEISGLRVHFDTLDGKVEALNSVDLEVNKGQIMGLVGESGCGKSVTSLVTIGLATCEVDEGSVKYEGEELLFRDSESTSQIKEISGYIVVMSVLLSIFGGFWTILIDPIQGRNILLGFALVSSVSWGVGFLFSKESRAHEKFMRWVRGNEISMIFQEPMTALNPLYSVEKQISEVMREHGRLVDPETPTINRIGEALFSPFSLIYRTLAAKPQSSAAFLSVMAFVIIAHRQGFADEAQPWAWLLMLVVPLMYSISNISRVRHMLTDEMSLEERVAMETSFSGSGFSMDRIDPRTGTVFSEYSHMETDLTAFDLWLRSLNPRVWLFAHRFGVSLQGLPAASAITIVVFLMLWMPFSSLMGMVVISSLLALPVIIGIDFLRLDPAHSRQVQEILEDVRIPNPEAVVKMYPHELSGGMRQRVMIGMMMSCEPKLLIADEPTTALDVTIQAQILKLMMDLRDEKGTSILLITHDLGVIAEMCDDVTVMYAGRVVERAPVKELFANPLHAYTRGLMACTPNIASTRKSILPAIPGQVANPSDFVSGCRFCQRMDRQGSTLTNRPQMIESSPGHWVEACQICLDVEEDKWE